jgi:hypothetical protein
MRAFIYFTYNHSPKKIRIVGTTVISEFQTIIIMPLFLILSVATVLARKGPRKHS